MSKSEKENTNTYINRREGGKLQTGRSCLRFLLPKLLILNAAGCSCWQCEKQSLLHHPWKPEPHARPTPFSDVCVHLFREKWQTESGQKQQLRRQRIITICSERGCNADTLRVAGETLTDRLALTPGVGNYFNQRATATRSIIMA